MARALHHMRHMNGLVSAAQPVASKSHDESAFHGRLSDFNRARLAPTVDAGHWANRMRAELEMRALENLFVERERARVVRTAILAPKEAADFVAWFVALKDNGEGQHDPFFPWLAKQASLFELSWFLNQEVAASAGFEDLVAMTQVKLPARAKVELARNYWDEMGQGNEGGMHGPMLEHLGRKLGLEAQSPVWESQALGNLMVALASNRHYAYQSIGALAVTELTSRTRNEQVNLAMKRLGFGNDLRRYFSVHSTLDSRHAETWVREVIQPLVAGDPAIGKAIAEGALMRLHAGARCYDRYRRELGFVEGVEQRLLVQVAGVAATMG
jgi:hypothetical protein